MLASARPLFENLPGGFADPLGLADQQAAGVVALIVARYDDGTDTNASNASKTSTTAHGALDDEPPTRNTEPASATYDTFVAASGGLVAVARTTPDYRFPVSPAAAVARFHAARDAGRAPALSLYAVSEADAARLLETAFYAECLKVHVDGAASAPLVREQLARCGCRSGLLEANDFSDAAAPTVRLADVTDSVPLDLDALLDGVHGRVLLYDRAKNQAVARDRASAPLDLAAAVAEADRLARARRPQAEPSVPTGESDSPSSPVPAAGGPLPSLAGEASAVAADLRQRAEAPAPPSPLSALVAELQGRTPPPEAQEESPLPSGEGQGESLSTAPTSAPASPVEPDAPADDPQTLTSEPAAPHPLAADLDRLRTDAYVLLEAAVGRDRAQALDAHVRTERGLPSPLPPERTLDLVRALLLDAPPRRWHLFKRARAKTHGDVAALLLAFHAAHGHDPRPRAQAVVMEATQLWTRLHK